MTTRPHLYLSSRAYKTSIAPPLVLLSQAEAVSRIEAIRAAEAPPICAACGSTTPNVKDRKWCPCCKTLFPVACFSRNRAQFDGLAPACKPCRAKQHKLYRIAVARNDGIGTTGVRVKVDGRMGRAR